MFARGHPQPSYVLLLGRELCWWVFWPEQRWSLKQSEGRLFIGWGAVLSCPVVMGYISVTPWETLC